MAEDTQTGPAPVLYVTDLTYERYDPADLFDLAFLRRSPDHRLVGVCLTADAQGDGARVLGALGVRQRGSGGGAALPHVTGADGLLEALRAADEPVNLVVTGGYAAVRAARERERALFREKVARLFVVGGVVNDYSRRGAEGERLPIDPRLKERNPERFGPEGDPRAADPVEGAALGALLTSGEAVIWLPRDICLWRYAAPQILSDGGEVCEFLIRELFYARLQALGPGADRYDAADAPVLLSALPALLLAVRPDPSLWLRLFRAVLARAEVDAAGSISDFVLKPENPNLYAVIAIDGRALGKLLTARLRDRPLVAEG